MQYAVEDPRYGTSSGNTVNRRVYVTTDGGIFRTENILTASASDPDASPTPIPAHGWQQLNSTYQTTQFYSAAGDARPGATPLIYGGSQDTGGLRLNAGNQDALQVTGSDGGGSDVNGNTCYGQDGAELWRIKRCDLSPPPIGRRLDVAPGTPPIFRISDYVYGAVGLASIIVDPGDPDRMFFGASSVWRSDNVNEDNAFVGPLFSEIKVNPIINQNGTPCKPVRISAAAVASSDPNVMWVAEFNPFDNCNNLPSNERYGRLYRTKNSTATPAPTASNPTSPVNWTTIDDNINPTATPSGVHHDPLPNRKIQKIYIDPLDPQKVYVGLAASSTDNLNLWRTTNGLDPIPIWTPISGATTDCTPDPSFTGLPCVPINAIVSDIHHPGKLIVGTDIGIYVSNSVSTSTVTWQPVATGPENVKVTDLNYIKGSSTILAATYGRGLWTTLARSNLVVDDFDGDGRSDIAVVRSDGSHLTWHLDGSTDGYRSQEFGALDDQVAPADYDGDGKTDITVFRPSEKRWYSLLSGSNTIATTALGEENDKGVPADFDGDGLADKAVWKPFTGTWEVQQSAEGYLAFQWGASGDQAVAMDFDGDGKADFGALHEANGVITLSYHAESGNFQKQFGLEGDVAVPGDYDGDGRIDLAVWRPDDDGYGNGCWYITYARDGFVAYDAVPWGVNGDVPVPGDYDGDGKLDIAVWRPADGMWHIRESSNGYYSQRFGADSDTPVGIKAVYASRPTGASFTRVPRNAVPKRRTR